MAKIVLNNVEKLTELSTINENFNKIEAEFQDKVLYRNNPVGEPNTVEKDVDMNGKNIINANEVRASDVLVDGASISTFFADMSSQVAEAAASAAQAEAASNAIGIPEIANYAALRAYNGVLTSFYVKGVTNPLDGGAGVFRVDASDTTSADNGGTILVDALGRRWKREFSGPAFVEWYGAISGEVTDCTSAIQAAINANEDVIAKGRYKTTAPLVLRTGVKLRGIGRGVSRIGAVGCTAISSPLNTQHATVEALELVGNGTATTYGIHAVNNSRGLKIRDVYVRNFGAAGNGAGIFLTWDGATANMWGSSLEDVVVESCGRGFVLDHAQATVLKNCIARLCLGNPFDASVSPSLVIVGGAYENSNAAHGATASIAIKMVDCDQFSLSGVWTENCINSLLHLENCNYGMVSGFLGTNTTGVTPGVVRLVGSSQNVFAGMRIDGIDEAGCVGLALDASSNYNTFIGVQIETDGSSAGGSTPLSDLGTGNNFLATNFSSNFYDKLNLSGPATLSGRMSATYTKGDSAAQSVGNGFSVNAGNAPTKAIYELSSSGAVASDATLALGNGENGQVVTLANVGTFTITLKQNANTQLSGGVDFAMGAKATVTLYYSTAAGDWLEIGRKA